MPFQPRGPKSQRVIIVEAASTANYDDVLTFEELAAKLGLSPVSDRDQLRQAVAAARPLLLQDHLRALVSVRGKGYRVAKPGEQAGMAQMHRQKADRQITRALDLVKFADEGAMTPEERHRHQAVGVVLTNLYQRMNAAEENMAQMRIAAERRFIRIEKALGITSPAIISGEVE